MDVVRRLFITEYGEVKFVYHGMSGEYHLSLMDDTYIGIIEEVCDGQENYKCCTKEGLVYRTDSLLDSVNWLVEHYLN